jgi:hypothetical protein
MFTEFTFFSFRNVLGGYVVVPLEISVARWYIFKPKIPIWVNFGRSCKRRCWYFYGHFVYFSAKLYVLWPFWPLDTFCGHLVYFSRFPNREKSGNPA